MSSSQSLVPLHKNPPSVEFPRQKTECERDGRTERKGKGHRESVANDGGKTIIFPLNFPCLLFFIVLPLLTHCLLPLDDNILEIQELGERNVDEG